MSNDFLNMRDKLVTLLTDNLATLNSSMTASALLSTTGSIRPGRPEYGAMSAQLPIIFVALNEYSEALNSLGPGGHRDNELTFDLYPVTQFGYGSTSGTGQAMAEDECNRLTRNICDLLRDKPDLSGTVSYVQSINVDFNQEFGQDSTYVKCNHVTVRCFKFVA